MSELNRMAPGELTDSGTHPVLVILDNIRSMHNVGAAFRTCDAFRAEGLYLCGYTPAPPHRDIHKTALGATETVRWRYFPDTVTAVHQAKSDGYRILCVEQAHGSDMLHEFRRDTSEKTALVFGNEVGGVDDNVLALADGCLEIPQWGAKHSLNISVSLGIVLWELVRPIS